MTQIEVSSADWFRLAPFEKVAPEVFHVIDRDQPGVALPFHLNYAQQQMVEQYRKAIQLNLMIQLELEKQGKKSYISGVDPVTGVNIGLKGRYSKVGKFAASGVKEWEIGLKVLQGKSRRAGCSTLWGHIALRRICTVPNYPAMVMSHDEEAAQGLWDIAKFSYDSWPEAQLPLRPETDRDNTQSFRTKINSQLTIRTANAANRSKAKSRGGHYCFIHFSEYAHYSSYTDASQLCTVAPPHAWIIKESTANGRSGPFYEEWQKAMTVEDVQQAFYAKDWQRLGDWSGYYKIFFSWLDDPGLRSPVFAEEEAVLLDSLDEYEQNLRAKDKRFTAEKIKFRRERLKNGGTNSLSPEQFFKQEFPATEEEMFQVGGAAVFDQAALDRIEVASAPIANKAVHFVVDGMNPPKRAHARDSNLIIYEPPREERSYVIGADAAQGVGKDESCALVLDVSDGVFYRLVAAYATNMVQPETFGEVLCFLGELYNTAFIIPEINGPGLSVKNRLAENLYPFVYRRMVLDAVEQRPFEQIGFQTTNQTKNRIISTAREIVAGLAILIPDPKTMVQLRQFSADEEDERKLGRKSIKDDHVIALSLALFAGQSMPVPKVKKQSEEPPADKPANDVGWEKDIAALVKQSDRLNRKARSGFTLADLLR